MSDSPDTGKFRSRQKESSAAHAQRSSGRKLAEWVSLGISLAIILSLAGYLVFEALQENSPFVPVEVRPLVEQVQERQGSFVLPVRVDNRGGRTLHGLKLELNSWPKDDPQAQPTVTDLTIDYLGERSSQTVYFYLDQHPRDLKLTTRPVSYRVE